MNIFYAEKFIQDYVNQNHDGEFLDEYVVSSIEMSDCKQFWIAGGSSRGYVEYGLSSFASTGGGLFLLHIETKEIYNTMPGQLLDFIQDFHEVEYLQGRCYVLICDCEPDNKSVMLRLRRRLSCSLLDVKRLIAQERVWFSGRRRLLVSMQQWLAECDIPTVIEIVESSSDALNHIDAPYGFMDEHQTYFHLEHVNLA